MIPKPSILKPFMVGPSEFCDPSLNVHSQSCVEQNMQQSPDGSAYDCITQEIGRDTPLLVRIFFYVVCAATACTGIGFCIHEVVTAFK